MNRRERRSQTKAARIKRLLDDLSAVEKIKSAIQGDWPLKGGDRVQLNMEVITSRPNYQSKTEQYRQFCEANAGRVFTVEYDGSLHPSVVHLKEDESNPKWLFWVGDLKKAAD